MSISLAIGSDRPLLVSSLTDLENAARSDLNLGSEFTNQLDKPISNLPAALSSTSIQYSGGNQSWKVGDFTFALSRGVSGKVSVITSGDLFSYTDGFATKMATGLNLTRNANPTASVSVPSNTAFVCIDLDLSIQGASPEISRPEFMECAGAQVPTKRSASRSTRNVCRRIY